MKQKKFSFFFKSTLVLIGLKMINFFEIFMTCFVNKSINISDYGFIFACGAIYSQNAVSKTFLI